MADSTVTSALQVTQWNKKLRYEYVRDMQLRKLMGTSVNAPIQIVTDLKANSKGHNVYVPLITRLTGSGQANDDVLEGNEEALGNYGHQITVAQIRHGVRVGHDEETKTFFDLLQAAKPMLKKWAMAKLRDDILAAAMSPNVDGNTAYASCTETQKDAWLAANSDRVLFGAAKSNNASNDHSAALLNVDSSSDILQPNIVSLAKRMAKTADRHMTPVQVSDKGEWFVLLANSLAFRDLKNHATMNSAHYYARERGKDNPLFTDGDLMWDGVIIKECEELSVISGVGNTSIDVAANFLLGAQSIGVGVGEEVHAIKNVRDYGNLKAVGVAERRGVDKLMWNSIQNMLTIYTAAVADT